MQFMIAVVQIIVLVLMFSAVVCRLLGIRTKVPICQITLFNRRDGGTYLITIPADGVVSLPEHFAIDEILLMEVPSFTDAVFDYGKPSDKESEDVIPRIRTVGGWLGLYSTHLITYSDKIPVRKCIPGSISVVCNEVLCWEFKIQVASETELRLEAA